MIKEKTILIKLSDKIPLKLGRLFSWQKFNRLKKKRETKKRDQLKVENRKIIRKEENQMRNKITNLIRIKKVSHVQMIGLAFTFVIFVFVSNINIASADSTINTGSYTTANAATWSANGGNATIPSGQTATFAAGTYNFGSANVVISGTLIVSPSSTTVNGATGVVITTTGNITVSGTINGNGKGYVGGGSNGVGYGEGPGSGYGWDYVYYGGSHGSGPAAYGSSTNPVTLGSGGIGIQNSGLGGAGGGAIKLNAPNGTVTIQGTGSITMDGVSYGTSGSGGAGGSIWIVANNFTSSGSNDTTISAAGGVGSPKTGAGAGGRISLQIAGSDTYAGNILVPGGTGLYGSALGTINRTVGTPGDITIAAGKTVTWTTGEHTFNNITINGTLTTGNAQGGSSTLSFLTLYPNGAGNGGGKGGYTSPGGAGHGGAGGSGNTGSSNYGPGGVSYDTAVAPTLPGSGGGGIDGSFGGYGGGYMKLTISGILTNNGSILANGLNGSGGGSGGSIFINAPSGSVAGAGIYSAVGGVGSAGGGGAGGRIAFNSGSISFSGSPTITVAGASGSNNGGNGTITGLLFSSITAPTNGSSTKTLAITGTAADYSGGTLQYVDVSIKNNATGYWWNGSSFGSASQFWNRATSTASWSYTPSGLPSLNGISLTIQSRLTSTGGVESSGSGVTMTFDNVAPTLSAPSIAANTNTHTPSFSFTASEVGTISYGGSCASVTTSAASGSNSIVFNSLVDGTYSNCTVTVTDAATNASTALAVPTFTVDTVAPTVSLTASKTAFNAPFTVTATFSEPVNAITNANVTLGGVGGSVGAVTTVSSSIYTFVVTPTGDGTVTINILANAVTDLAGNGNVSSTAVPAVGDSYGGGKVAYLLVNGDPGYVAGQTKGLIVATSDQSTGIQWAVSAYQFTYVTGTLTIVGSGSANTDKIIAQNGIGSTYAAGIARAYNGGGYSDWYLPSKDELSKLYTNKGVIGGINGDKYYSSSEGGTVNNIWQQNFTTGAWYEISKGSSMYVRAVRSFSSGTLSISYDSTRPTTTIGYSLNRNVKPGEVQRITATFSEAMADAPIPQVSVSGATTLAATNMVKTDTTHYYYDYTVGAGNGTDTVALNTGMDIATNLIVGAPTSGATFVVDNVAPSAAITYSLNRNVKSGDSQVITATFSELMADAPIPQISISGTNTLAATNMTKVDTTHYTYTYTVGAGDGTATVALSTGTDIATNVITSAPTSGATFTVDNTAPTATVTYTKNPTGVGTNTVTVGYNEDITSTPTISINQPGSTDIPLGTVMNGPGSAWVAKTASSASNWYSVAYGNGTFVAVANGGTSIMISNDNGQTWQAKTAPSSSPWYSVTYGNGTFVAVAYGSNAIMISNDNGQTWQAKTAPSVANWQSVTYGNGTFVAIAYMSNAIMISNDNGQTWQAKTAPSSTYWQSVTYGNGTFVAISQLSTSIMISSDQGQTWQAKTAPSAANWYSVTYGNGTFVAVASGSTAIMVSNDNGQTWQAKTAQSASNWYSVTYGNGTFVAIARNSTAVMISSDQGQTWKAKTAPSSSPWFSVTYGNGTFVAVALSSTAVMTSTANYNYDYTVTKANGTTYIDGTANVSISSVSDAAGNAVTVNSTFAIDTTGPKADITYSINHAVKQGNSQIITATFSKPMADAPIPQISISGVNTVAATNMTKVDATHYTYTYTVGAGDGTDTVALSTGTDTLGNPVTSTPNSGATFVVDNTAPTVALAYTANPTVAGTNTISATYSEVISSSPTVSVNQPGTTDISNAAMSAPGSAWTGRTGVASGDWESIAYGNGTFVAVLKNSNIIETSPDGVTWTVRTASSSAGWARVAYGNGVFVVADFASGSSKVMTSPDGITWTARTAVSGSNWQSIAYGNGIFVVASGSSNKVMTSPDGITWTAQTAIYNSSWQSIAYGNGVFVAVGYNSNALMTSPDGITWTAQTAPVSSGWYSITYGNNTFVAVSFDGLVMTSPDGINWTMRTASSASHWGSVSYGNGIFLTVAFGSNAVMTSPDGINWTARTSSSSENWASLAYGNNTFVAVSNNNAKIMTSPANYSYDYTVNKANGGTYQDGTATVSLSTVTDVAGNNASAPSNNTFVIETIPPTITAPITAAQVLKSGVVTTSNVQIDKAGDIYIVKHGTSATTLAAINSAITAKNAFKIVTGATANSPYTFTIPVSASINDGAYDFVAVSTIGNVSDPTSGATSWLTIDNTAPVITVTSNATATGALKIGDSIIFTVTPGTAETNITGITPVIYNGKAITWTTVNAGVSYKATYTVVAGDTDQVSPLQLTGVVMTDQAGNASLPVDGTDVAKTIDANAPTNQDTVFPADVYKKAQASVSLIPGNATDTVWFAPTGTTVFAIGPTMSSAGGAASTILSPQTEGTYKLYVIDAAGNYSLASSHSLFIDATAPVVSTPFNTPQILKSGATSSSTVQINEAGKIYLIKRGIASATQANLDSAVNTNHNGFVGVDPAQGGIPSTVTLPAGLVDGVYDVVGIDTVGNISAPFSGWLTVDNTIPTSVITAPVDVSILNGLTSIAGTAADANGVSNVKYSLKNLTTSKWYDGSGFNSNTEIKLPVDSGTTSWNTTLADTIWTRSATDYTLKSYATDVAQNSEVTGASVTFTVDKTAPTITVTYALKITKSPSNLITVTYSKPLATGQAPKISIDQSGSADISNADMVHPSSKVFTYDYQVHAANGNTYKDGLATISLTDTFDSAGNKSENPVDPSDLTFTIDTTSPTSAIDAVCGVTGNGCTEAGKIPSPDYQQAFRVATLTGTTADTLSGVNTVDVSIQDNSSKLYFKDGDFTSVSEEFLPTTLSTDKITWSFDSTIINKFIIDNVYNIHSRATDVAGNMQSNGQPLSFIFSNSPPTVSNVTASQGTDGNVNVTYDVTDNESDNTYNMLFYGVGATLALGIDSSTQTISLSSASNLPNAGGYILIDDEIIHYTGKSGNTLTGVTRHSTLAFTNTTSVSHSAGKDVYVYANAAIGAGVGDSPKGTAKAITWPAKTDIDGYENLNEQIIVVAHDHSTGSMIGKLISGTFNFNTKNPTATGLKINGTSSAAESTSPNITLALEGVSGSLSGTNMYTQFSRDDGVTWYGANANGTLSAVGTLGSGFSPNPTVAEAITWPWTMQARNETIKVKLTDSFGNYSTVSNTVQYNSAPEFDSSFGTDGISVSQISLRGDANFGKVKIDYKVRDADNTTATPTFSYDVSGGTDFTSIDGAELGGVSNAITPSYVIHTVYWTPAKGAFSTTNTNFKISLNDNEPINNISSKTITPVIIDTTAPVVANKGVTFDAGEAGVINSGKIHIIKPADISDMEYKITDVSNNSTVNNTTVGVWVSWNNADTTKDIPWTFDSRLAAKSLTYQFRDKYGNGDEVSATPVTISTLAPVDEQSFLIQDTTNTYLHKYELYIGWGPIISSDFSSYKLEYATSLDNYAVYSTVVDSGMNDSTKNFYIDNNNLNPNLFYKYRLGVADKNGNISVRAGTGSSARPNGIQDGTEGGGASIPVASVVENIIPTQDVITRNVSVTYKLSDSSYTKKTNASYEARLFYNLGVTLGPSPYSDAAKTLKVSDASKFSATGGYIQINNEVLKYTGKDAVNNLLTGIVRGTWPASTTRFTRQNNPFFSGTPVWMMANDATPNAIADVSTIELTGVTGTMSWNMVSEPLLLESVYTNVGVRVLVHDNQPAQSGPLSTQNDLTESGILNTLDLSKPTVGFTSTEGTGDEAVTSVLIPVALDHSYVLPTTVSYAVTGTAVRDVNYTLADGTVTFAPGETAKNISLTILNDNTRSSDKTIIVTLSPSPTNAILGANTIYTYTLKGEGAIPAINFSNPNYSSGPQTLASVSLPLNLSSSSITDTTVDYTVSGTAISGENYTLAPGTVTIRAGSIAGSIPLTVINSGFTGQSRTVVVNLTNPTNATIGDFGQYVYTILNEEIIPTVQFQSSSATGSKTTASVNIPVTLSTASISSVTVAYAIKQSSTAVAGTDYILSPGTVTFAPGETIGNIPVIILNSALKGIDKTLSIQLSSPTNATLGTPSTFDYQILDDQSAVKVFFPSPSSEGLESTSSTPIVVALSSLSSQEISVDYTVSGTAVGGADYTLPSGTLKIQAGKTTKNIITSIINNSIYEPSKTIVVTLSNPVNAVLDESSKVFTYTILNDDAVPTVAFDSVNSSSWSRAVSSVNLPVALSAISGYDTSVSYTVSGSAVGGVDYTLAPGTITINKGIKTANIPITIINSLFTDQSKTVIVTLASPVNVSLGTTNTVYTYTILNPNYVLPTVQFQSDSATGSKTTASVNIPVTLSTASTSSITVAYAVKIDSTLTTAVAGTDYILSPGTVTFAPGETTKNISLSIINNALKGLDKKVSIELSSPAGSTLGTPSLFTYNIIDDQSAVKVFFPSGSSEGLESTSSASFTVALSSVSSLQASVDYTVTGTAKSGVDYTLANGTLRIPAGSTTKNIVASIINNNTYEPDKTIIVTLSNPVNAILDESGTVFTYKILNDDTAPTVAFSGPNSSSGAPTVSSLSLPIVLSAASGFDTVVSYTVTGTAVSGVDYAAVPGTVSIPLGSTTASIPLSILNSSFTDSSKTLVVTLTSASNAMLATTNTVYTYTIQNPNFSFPTVQFDESTGTGREDIAGTVNIPVSLSESFTDDVTVSYAATGGSAVGNGADYTLVNQTLIIPAGQTKGYIPLTIFDDTVYKGTRTVIITISSATNATVGSKNTFGYSILDNEISATETTGSNIKSTSARVLWTTSDYADSLVDYGTIPPGTEGAYNLSKANINQTLNHDVYLGNLTPSTTYYFKTTSTNLNKEVSVAESQFTTTPGPIISGVAVSDVTDTEATVTWTTDIPTSSYVSYSKDSTLASPGRTGVDESVTNHSVKLTKLASQIEYYYLVDGTDSAGNVGEDAKGGDYYSFTTTKDLTPPIISDISTPIITSTQVAIIWTTNEPADGRIRYGLTPGTYDSQTELIAKPTVGHLVAINGLTEKTKYYYRIDSADVNYNSVSSEEQSFTTPEKEKVIVNQGGGGIQGVAQDLYDLLLAENENYKAKFGVDLSVPTISDIQVADITPFSATVSFTTSKDSIAFVNYGKDDKYGFSSADSVWAKVHTIKLHGLSLGTEYNFQISVFDKSNNVVNSDNQKFTTKYLTEDLAALKNIDNVEQYQAEIEKTIESILPSLVPPFIDKPVITNITENSATVTFKTNVKAYPVLSYTTDANYTINSTKDNPYDGEISDTSEKTIEHILALIGLKSNTKYHIMAKAFSLPQVIGKSDDIVFTTAASKIQGSIIDVKNDSFTVVWSTDSLTSSIVEYKNLTTGRISRIVDDVKNTSHSLRVENLTPGTTYQVTISGINEQGNLVEGSAPLNVKTSVDITPPVISNLKVDSSLVVGLTNKVQTIVSWQTDEPSTSKVYYQEGSGSLSDKLANNKEDVELTKNHVIILTSLNAGTVYRFIVESADNAGNINKTPIRTIITPKKTESIVDVIFKNFDSTFNFINGGVK